MASKDVVSTGAHTPNLFEEMLEDTVDASELFDEGKFVEDKNYLVGIPMIITKWTHAASDNTGLLRVDVDAVLQNGERVRFVDFGSGIRFQLEDATKKLYPDRPESQLPFTCTPKKAVYLPNGLRVSKYSKADTLSGKNIPAETFYLGL